MLWWLHAALLTSGKHVGSDGGSQHWPAVTSHLQITERAVREAGTDEQVVISRNGVPVYTFERNRAAELPHHGQWSSTFLGSPAMISQEAALIKSYLFKDATMLEWGSGGSTLAFSPLVSRYYAIEDNENWARLVDKQLKERRIAGASVSWVKPDAARGRMTRPAAYKTYCAHAAVAAAKMGVKTFDFVLIDGRGRQFCAKQVLPFVTNATRVFVHDFPLRQRYWSVFDDFYEVASVKENGASAKGLVVLSRRRA